MIEREYHYSQNEIMADEEAPTHLQQVLQEQLPTVGLDYETYGPYVLGCDDDADPDELDNVFELLQASSEIEEDETKWNAFKDLIRAALQKDKAAKEEHAQLKAQEQQERAQKLLQDAKKEQEEQQKVAKPKAAASSSALDDSAKKALLDRFAYEQPDDADDAADQTKGNAPVTNKQAAQQANLEQARSLRAQKVQTKQDEQAKTKADRKKKQELKEQRQKRAQKGERKR